MAGLPDRGVDEALALLDARMAQLGPSYTPTALRDRTGKEPREFPGAIERMAGLDQRLRATPQWQVEVAELLLQAGRRKKPCPT